MRLKAMIAATLLGSFTPSYAGDKQPIDAALSEAEAEAGLRYSYTMKFEWPGEAPITVRYDAGRDRWSTLDGNPDALPREAKKKLGNIKKSESEPGGLLYADFREYLDDITLVNETDDQYIYRFIPSQVDEDDVTGTAEDVVRARLYVAKDDQRLARYEVKGLKPFKPNPAAKMEEFEVVQEFERLGENGPAVLRKLYSRQKGEQFFRSVDTEFTATFSDFEKVE
ncbi:hypothetical protein [Parvularcula marina]|uniref:hypothetical protein n=1 Tax=Parvularcula marina TaxID=2292771 RepID=UPI0035175A95